MSKFQNLSTKSRIIIITALVLVVCLIIASGVYIFIGSRMLSRYYYPDLVISSPDGQHELVIREFTCLGGAGAEIYIRKTGHDKWYNSWMKKQIGNASAGDYYRTFANGTYYVEWESDKVAIYYYQGVQIENVDDPDTWRGVVSYEFE